MLRPHHAERKFVRHHTPSHAAESAAEEPLHPTGPEPTAAETAEPPLSPAEKQRLFQDFQSYLARTGQAP